MHRKALALLALPTFLLTGCVTPTQRWDSATLAIQATREVTMTLHSGGAITDDDVREVHKVDLATRGALDVAYTQLPGGGDTFDHYMDVAEAGLKGISDTYGKPASNLKAAK